jgi:hypothetical protein
MPKQWWETEDYRGTHEAGSGLPLSQKQQDAYWKGKAESEARAEAYARELAAEDKKLYAAQAVLARAAEGGKVSPAQLVEAQGTVAWILERRRREAPEDEQRKEANEAKQRNLDAARAVVARARQGDPVSPEHLLAAHRLIAADRKRRPSALGRFFSVMFSVAGLAVVVAVLYGLKKNEAQHTQESVPTVPADSEDRTGYDPSTGVMKIITDKERQKVLGVPTTPPTITAGERANVADSIQSTTSSDVLRIQERTRQWKQRYDNTRQQDITGDIRYPSINYLGEDAAECRRLVPGRLNINYQNEQPVKEYCEEILGMYSLVFKANGKRDSIADSVGMEDDVITCIRQQMYPGALFAAYHEVGPYCDAITKKYK